MMIWFTKCSERHRLLLEIRENTEEILRLLKPDLSKEDAQVRQLTKDIQEARKRIPTKKKGG